LIDQLIDCETGMKANNPSSLRVTDQLIPHGNVLVIVTNNLALPWIFNSLGPVPKFIFAAMCSSQPFSTFFVYWKGFLLWPGWHKFCFWVQATHQWYNRSRNETRTPGCWINSTPGIISSSYWDQFNSRHHLEFVSRPIQHPASSQVCIKTLSHHTHTHFALALWCHCVATHLPVIPPLLMVTTLSWIIFIPYGKER
jgi:hypothetical protein